MARGIELSLDRNATNGPQVTVLGSTLESIVIERSQKLRDWSVFKVLDGVSGAESIQIDSIPGESRFYRARIADVGPDAN